MEEEFKNYLVEIGFTQILINRVEGILENIESLFSVEITDIFVENYFKDSEQEYDALYLFSSNLCICADNFIVKDDFRVTYLTEHILTLKIMSKEYNIKDEEFNDNSKFVIFFSTDLDAYGDYKSAKNNCNYLKKILTKYLIPNLKK